MHCTDKRASCKFQCDGSLHWIFFQAKLCSLEFYVNLSENSPRNFILEILCENKIHVKVTGEGCFHVNVISSLP